MGIFSALGGLFGASSNRKAIQQASDAANAGLQKGIDQTNTQIGNNNQAYSPYTSAGTKATSSVEDMLGLNGPEAQQAAIAGLQDSPLFKSQYNQGVNTILQNGSATGGLRGGDIQNGLAQFGSGLLSDVQQKQLSDLFGLSNEGLTATGAQTGLNSQLSSGIANMFNQQGQNTSSAILGKHQATNAGINGLTGYLDAQGSQGASNGSNIFSMLSSLF